MTGMVTRRLSPGGRAIARALAGLAALLGLASAAAAHPLAPSLFQVQERAGGRIDVTWKTPRLQPRGGALEPVLPERCAPLAAPRLDDDGGAVRLRWTAACGEAGLAGATFRIAGLAASGTDALLRIVPLRGRPIQALLSAGREEFTVPDRQSLLDVAADYATLGFTHILGGLDHLLFVLGLVLLLPGWRRLLPVVTAFTAGHSVTLALVTLGALRLPQGPVEIAIAGSIVVLAARLCRSPDEAEAGVPAWAMAAGFGLLHGMGFAGALAEVGLPDAEIPLALFAFNVGIELGQLAFVAALLGVGGLLGALAPRRPEGWVRVPAYAMGSLAAFLCLQRAALWL
jgi:hydrogenase/urease accessory protein HupE